MAVVRWGVARVIGRRRRPLRKGLQCVQVCLPPLRGPDRYQLRAIKLSPCHLRRIQSRVGKGRRGGRVRRERGMRWWGRRGAVPLATPIS